MPLLELARGLFVFLLACTCLGCVDPCSRLLETLCKDLPDEHHCRSYREKVSKGDISPEMCAATRRAYVASLEKK